MGLFLSGFSQNEQDLLRSWLSMRPETTSRVYRSEMGRLKDQFPGRSLLELKASDLEQHLQRLTHLKLSSQRRARASIQSFYAWAMLHGVISQDPSLTLKKIEAPESLSARILSETEVQRILALETDPRNRCLLSFLYYAGVRVSEACQLIWKFVEPREEGRGQITVIGKRNKARVILLPQAVFSELMKLKETESRGTNERKGELDPVFCSSRGEKGRLDPSQVFRIVRTAALRAGISKPVSPHWFRHAHVSHALDRGCPAHLVQATVGHASLATTTKYSHARPQDSSARYLGA
jgi:integrase/recombinase XerD